MLSDTPEVESKGWDEKFDCYRMCVYVILQAKVGGERFTFMNTHFGFGDKGQIISVKLIEEYSQKISAFGGKRSMEIYLACFAENKKLLLEFMPDGKLETSQQEGQALKEIMQ